MLVYWWLKYPTIVETDVFNYMITVVFLVQISDSNIHPVTFQSHIISGAKLNYNTYNKESLVIYKAFHIWWHCLDSVAKPIEVLIDHKNLEYFTTF